MRRFRSLTLALLALFLLAPKADAQFAYTIENFQTFFTPGAVGYSAGFTATALFENVNTYDDPAIVRVTGFTAGLSPSLQSLCSWLWYNYDPDACALGGGASGIRGNVQTSDIVFAPDDYYDYSGGFWVDSCASRCTSIRYFISAGAGLLGCQGMYPRYGTWFSGRTCDADGYDGKLSINVVFWLYAPIASAPLFQFRESDFVLTPTNVVDPYPNAFVHVTPEPATWLLMATGLTLVGATVRKRERRAT